MEVEEIRKQIAQTGEEKTNIPSIPTEVENIKHQRKEQEGDSN
jgi:hypothetical protein